MLIITNSKLSPYNRYYEVKEEKLKILFDLKEYVLIRHLILFFFSSANFIEQLSLKKADNLKHL